MWFEFTKIKGAKIILYVKLLAFRVAKLKGFTIVENLIKIRITVNC